ncbi:hypothetical protein LCGC14_1739610 [marine sediment metagenome]|uniref:Uncharacterized protein n=1 Tax=marine sediment metagenome TaxID=412755 RepID=A0A0F9HUP4_9ZZZZ
MTMQDLSPKELKICALLYSGSRESVLFDLAILFNMSNEVFAPFGNGEASMIEGYRGFYGTWYRRPFYTTGRDTIQSLTARGVIKRHKKCSIPFYTLNICEEHEEFFKELKIQIAIGSI